MYTTTFYSFKGGVGRTLALVNVGVELANAGKKVLLIDFDLEAPGIDTFEELQSPIGQAGIVDFICDYVRTGTPPNFDAFHYRAPFEAQNGGGVWVMPAGGRGSNYGTNLASIDWKDLYANRSGFLLLEDLKAQWAEQLNPDYVLIDSRTGHTEVGGICTRQLPDTVVVLFIPNEQNLSGLVGVVEAIRLEEKRSNRRPIHLEFVASNVPSLDDEEEILESMMQKFRSTLNFEKPSVINRYDSLHLINQSIFVLRRPRTRLAKAYKSLMRRVTRHNIEDRDAALRTMKEMLHTENKRFDLDGRFKSEDKIKEIISKHPDDAEMLSAAARFWRNRGESRDAESLFNRAVSVATKKGDPSSYKYALEADGLRISLGNFEGVSDSIRTTLQSEFIDVDGICLAIKLLREIGDPPAGLGRIPSVRKLQGSELAQIASQMTGSRKWQRACLETLLGGAELSSSSLSDDADWIYGAVLASIGLGEFSLAIKIIRQWESTQSGPQHISFTFNLAMATWGLMKEVPKELFAEVIASDLKTPGRPSGANYEQCLALAEYLAGSLAIANVRLHAARTMIEKVPIECFSCWQYLDVPAFEFIKDLETMEKFFAGASILPKFMDDSEASV